MIGQNNRRPSRGGRPGGGGASAGSSSLLSNMLGGRTPRYNRFMDKLSSGSIIFKVPDGVGSDEYNIMLGLGVTVIAPAGTSVITAVAPRDIILRRIQLQNGLSLPDVDFLVNSIAVEGNATVLGSGVGGGIFSTNNFNPPCFDLPVAGGTSVAISVTNTSAAGQEIVGALIID